jgi:hypothetical protein
MSLGRIVVKNGMRKNIVINLAQMPFGFVFRNSPLSRQRPSFWSKRSIHVNAEFVLLAHLSSEARSSPLAPSDIANALVNMKAADSNCRFSDHPYEPWSFCGVVGARESRLRFPREG